MGVNPATFAHGDHLNPLGGDIQGSDRQEEPEAREGRNGANLRFLKIPAVGLVIKKRLLDIEAQAVFLESMQTCRFVADDSPKLTIDGIAAKGHMHWAIPLLFVELNGVPTKRFPMLKMNVLQLAPPVTGSPNPSIALYPNPVVPA